MFVLIINSGSSSIKFRLYRMPEELVLADGKAEKDGKGDTTYYLNFKGQEIKFFEKGFSCSNALHSICTELTRPQNNCLQSLSEIDVAGHRLIHGGESGTGCVEITENVLNQMVNSISLAPLHYPANIAGINSIRKLMPGLLQTGVFDTAFHQTMLPEAYLYGIPLKWYEQYKIRKYGFHGSSHKYVSRRVCEITGKDIQKSRIISCHLGNGASLAAIKNGKSVDTTMGMTPVEGLLMGSRSGDIDAGVVLHLQQNFNLDLETVQEMLNEKGGLLGLSEVSSDLRDVLHAAGQGNVKAKLAIEVYVYRIKKYIGAYFAVLGGADMLVFTGGIGQNSAYIRIKCCSELENLGISISEKLNTQKNGQEAIISKRKSKIKVVIIPSNEELMIARETYSFVKSKQD